MKHYGVKRNDGTAASPLGKSWSPLSVVESAKPGGSIVPVFDAERRTLVLNFEDPVDLPPRPFVDQTPALYSTIASSVGPAILRAAVWLALDVKVIQTPLSIFY